MNTAVETQPGSPVRKGGEHHTRRQLETAIEALRAINNVGCANSHVVKSFVDWGLGLTDEPTLTVPPPALIGFPGGEA